METEKMDTDGESKELTKESRNASSGNDADKRNRSAVYQRKPGEAWIKAEYIIPDHQRVLSVQYIAQTDQLKQLAPLDNSALVPQSGEDGEAGEGKEQQGGEKRAADLSLDPPGKKIKLKGKNRSRLRHQTPRPDSKEKICPTILQERVCNFHEKGSCKFSHDIPAFMERKPPDLGDRCYLFETFGYCPYSISCRFGSKHISTDFKNIVNEELYEKTKATKTVINVLEKDVQRLLWKHSYDFSKANSITKRIRADFQRKMQAEGRTGKRGEAGVLIIPGTVSQRSEGKTSGESEAALSSQSSDNPASVGLPASSDESPSCPSLLSAASHTNSHRDPSASAHTMNETPVSNKAADKCHSSSPCSGTLPTDTSDAPLSAGDAKAASETVGCILDEDTIALRPAEKKKVDFRDKLYLAPLTTVGNLPFRRVCKQLGADITCSEMARSSALLQGNANEWALMKRHVSEDVFGIQICGGQPDSMARCAQLLNATVTMDFLDINCGCPIDYIFNHGEGCALMGRGGKFEQVCRSMTSVLDVPLTVKMRTGIYANKNIAHSLLPRLQDAGVSLVTLHGRSREQRYTRLADWEYIDECAKVANPMPLFGNGDVLSYEDYELQRQQTSVSGVMIGRGALIKPWVFQEIKEHRHWDISATERLDILRDFVHFGLEHWGSDQHGVNHTRRFLLEWLSFFHRYIPVGLMERLPQRINERPPYFRGRSDLETLLASANCADWVKISEMLLGPVPEGFVFLPKHKANAYQ